MRILSIEDGNAIAANLYDQPVATGYDPEHAADGVTGSHRALAGDWSAVLLDVPLPGMDDFTVYRKPRRTRAAAHIRRSGALCLPSACVDMPPVLQADRSR